MKRVWNEHYDNLLRRHYAKGDLDVLAARIGVTRGAVKARAQKLGLKRKVHVRHHWTDRHLAYLREHYADMKAEDIAMKIHHSIGNVWRTARKLGLCKSRDFMLACGRNAASTDGSKANRFKKGCEAWNKGKRAEDFMSADGLERSKEARFKEGHKPVNTKPVGYERINTCDGYVYIKISDDKKMVMKHRYIWEQHNGPVPAGYCVCFRDGNRQNCDIDNLFLLSRGENARRRVASETPEARKARVDKARTARNKSIRRDKIRIHFGLEPYGKLVKRW